MKYCRHIKISKDKKSSSVDVKKDLYKIDLLYLDDSKEEISNLDIEDLKDYIIDMENLYKSSFFKLVSNNIVSFANRKVQRQIMQYINDQLGIDSSKSISGDYDSESDWKISIKKTDDDKYSVYMYSPILGSSDRILTNVEQTAVVIDTFIRTHGLENYSFGTLVESGRIETIEDSNSNPVIQRINVMPSYSVITVEYENGSNATFGIEEFPNLISEIAKDYNNADDAFSQMYNDGKVTFEFSRNINAYGKNVIDVKIKSNGDVILHTGKWWLPLRKKMNITKNSQDVFDAITFMCYSNKKNFEDLVGDRITLATVKSKKVKKEVPKQVIFGKYLDTSVEPASVKYKYYAIYKGGYKEITKKEAIDSFNSLAKKKRVSKENIDKMFSKEYCKILPLDKVEEYVDFKKKSHIFNRFKRKEKEKKRSEKAKIGVFGKIGNFIKFVSKKLFGTTLKKLVALTTTVVIACSGIVSAVLTKKIKETKDKSSYSDNVDLSNDYTDPIIDFSNKDKFISLNKNLSISNNSYSDLLNKCLSNQNRKNSMQMVGSYLEKYNSKSFIDDNNVHNFDEVFYEYLAYNMLTDTRYNDILGKYNLDINKFKEVISSAISKDAEGHSVQTATMDKHIIIESPEGQALYKKYEDLFIEMNKETNVLKKSDYATQFYNMVRADLPHMSQNSYENVPAYMYIIEEFRLAMGILKVQTDNGFTEDEANYISGILDNVIVNRLQRANASNQVGYFVDEYYKNSTIDLCPTISDFRDASVLKSKTDDNSESLVLNDDMNISDKVDANDTLQSANDVTLNQSDTNEELVQSNSSDYVSVDYDNNESYSSSYNYGSNNDYSSYFDGGSVDVDNSIVDNVIVDSSDTSYSTDSIVDESITVDVECQIIDHYENSASMVESTLSPEDMAIVEEGVVESFDSGTSSNTVDDFISYDEEFNNSYYNEGVVDEEVVDNYEGVVSAPSDSEVYDQDDPLPDPNAIDSSSTNMSYEQIADLTVELMASPTNDSSYDKVYHL